MNVLLFLVIAAAMMSLSIHGIAQDQSSQVTAGPRYSRAQLKSMMTSAHTQQQYKVLADYFRQRQGTFQQNADLLLKELENRSHNVIGPAAKAPRPVDSAHNLYDYYVDEANKMGNLAARYEAQLAQPAQLPAHQ